MCHQHLLIIQIAYGILDLSIIFSIRTIDTISQYESTEN